MSAPTSSDTIQAASLPKSVPLTTARMRPPKKNVPQTKMERDKLLAHIRAYVEEKNPVPPMPLDELEVHAREILEAIEFSELYLHYTAVVLNNEMWRETMAAIPYERRLLLMPKCLRVEDKCPAPFDEFGLLCKQCGLCTIQDFQNEAERLGYAVLVAEGSAVVMSLIQTGKIEAIVGISCLPVLERTFPYVEAAAIPSIAVPLLQDDCIDTTVDIDWVWEYIHLTGEDETRRLNLNALHEDVGGWFSLEMLKKIMGETAGHAEEVAREWLARDGKRWRPFLTVAAYQALRTDRSEPIPDDARKLAVAVECFHKASLIHDDIEDQDYERYGHRTLHAEHGVAVALNAGDLLIGEGYRLIADCTSLSAEQKAAMMRVASEGQRELCRGQGAELAWANDRCPLKTAQVIEIFRCKTAPAFGVALKLGASFAGRLEPFSTVLDAYSEALGIAYQVKDDLDDMGADTGNNRLERIRPSIVLSKGRELARGEDRQLLELLWNGESAGAPTLEQVQEIVTSSGALEKCLLLLETYKQAAVDALRDIDEPNLKGLLRRVMGKIFNDLEIKGWCRENEIRNGVREN